MRLRVLANGLVLVVRHGCPLDPKSDAATCVPGGKAGGRGCLGVEHGVDGGTGPWSWHGGLRYAADMSTVSHGWLCPYCLCERQGEHCHRCGTPQPIPFLSPEEEARLRLNEAAMLERFQASSRRFAASLEGRGAEAELLRQDVLELASLIDPAPAHVEEAHAAIEHARRRTS